MDEDLGVDEEDVRLSAGGLDGATIDDTGASLDVVVVFEAAEEELVNSAFEENDEFNRVFEVWLDETSPLIQPENTERHNKMDTTTHASFFILLPPTVYNIRQQIIIIVGGELYSH